MSSNKEVGSSSRLTNRYRTLYALLHPDYDFVELCPLFFKSYKNEIGERVILVDQAGTQFKCILQSVNDTGFLAHGTHNIKEHYKLRDGGWLKLFYCDNDMFVIKVEDRIMREVSYPKPPKVYEVPLKFFQNFIHIDDEENDVENPVPEFKKIVALTENQATNNMNLPAKMVKEALFRRPVNCMLKDDSDRVYPCKICWMFRRETEAYITKRWKNFCKDNNLAKGSKVELSVKLDEQGKMFAETKNVH